jgi:hypothetical protein
VGFFFFSSLFLRFFLFIFIFLLTHRPSGLGLPHPPRQSIQKKEVLSSNK